jgi:hypothetical protein
MALARGNDKVCIIQKWSMKTVDKELEKKETETNLPSLLCTHAP